MMTSLFVSLYEQRAQASATENADEARTNGDECTIVFVWHWQPRFRQLGADL